MDGTSPKLTVVQISETGTAMAEGITKNTVVVPDNATVEVVGLPWGVTADLAYNAARSRMEIVELRIRRRDDSPTLPARAIRELRLEKLVVDALLKVAHRVTPVEDAPPWEWPATGKKISAGFAEQLAQGRTKTQDSLRVMRARAVQTYREVRAEREDWTDIYAEVARRLNIGRTTAWRHLKAAGEIAGYK